MNYYSTSAVLNAITSILVSSVILLNNPKSPKNRSFAYFGFFVFLWAFFYIIWITATVKESALFYMRISIGLAVFIPVTFFHFATNLIDEYKKYQRSIRLLYLFSFIIFLTAPFNLFISDAKPLMMFHYWPIAGITYDFHVLNYFSTPIFSFLIINQKIKSSPIQLAKQLKLVLRGIIFAYIGGATNFPLNYSIPFPPIGNIFVSLYTIFIAYAAFRYQLMNINLIIKKSLIYTLLITVITIFYLISIYFAEHILQSMLGYKSLFVSMTSATFIAVAFIPLRNIIQNSLERTFFRGSYMQITEENELLRREMTQSDRMKSIAILASGMAHEIKNPLTPIKTFSEQLPSRLDDKEFLLKFSKIINQEVDRIDSLVQELLTFAKPSPPQLLEVNIHQLIGQTLDLLNNEIIRHKIILKTSFGNNNILINIDPSQIKQALLNIFLNAIDAMPNGGTLSIVARSETTKQSFIIEISDTGCGINSKDLPHIFDPFFSKKDHGTGLGLSITHEIIKNHNGRILAESELGKGTTFKIELPL